PRCRRCSSGLGALRRSPRPHRPVPRDRLRPACRRSSVLLRWLRLRVAPQLVPWWRGLLTAARVTSGGFPAARRPAARRLPRARVRSLLPLGHRATPVGPRFRRLTPLVLYRLCSLGHPAHHPAPRRRVGRLRVLLGHATLQSLGADVPGAEPIRLLRDLEAVRDGPIEDEPGRA